MGILGTLAALLLSLHPQDKPKRDLADLTLEELLEVQVNEVVSASRFKQKIREAPASVTVVTAEDIRRFGYRSMAEVFKSVRGAYATYDRNYGYGGMRGFGLPADYNNRMLTMVNGHRLNDSVYDGVIFDNGFVIKVDDIERVEVVRGPASSLYGSNAFFGVINVMTRRGRHLMGGELASSVGSFDAYEGRASYGRLVEDGPEFYVSGHALGAGGQDHFFPEFDDPATGEGVNRNADRETAGHVFLHGAWKGFSVQGAYSERSKEVPTGSYGTNFPSRHTTTWDGMWFAELAYTHVFPDTFTVKGRVFADRYWYEGEYEYNDAVNGDFINEDSADGARWGAELVLSRAFLDERLRISAGTEFRDDYRQDQRNFDDVAPRVEYTDVEDDASLFAVFAQADWSPLDALRVNAGVRYDDYDTFGSTVNPRAGLIVAPGETTAVKLLYGRAFRAPTAYELNYISPTQKTNPDLDPETIDTYELVVEQGLGAATELVAALFHYRCDDLINLMVDPNDGLRVFLNESEVRTSGVELELRTKLESGVEGRVSWTYQEAKFDEGDSWLPNSPRNLAKAALLVPLGLDKVTAAFEAHYMGERRTLAKDEIDDFVILNLTISAREIAKGLDLSASVYNLFDEEYFDPGGTEHLQDQIEQDGLAFRVKLTWRF